MAEKPGEKEKIPINVEAEAEKEARELIEHIKEIGLYDWATTIDENDTKEVVAFKRQIKESLDVGGGDREFLRLTTDFLMEESKRLGDKKYRMLFMNLGANLTMNYSRINITETLLAFNFDREHTLNHWRMARAIDGMVMCTKELKICDAIGSPVDIPKSIYATIRDGKAQEKQWPLKNIKDPDGKEVEGLKASLADFANFQNLYDNHRALTTGGRLKLDDLVYQFFAGLPIEMEEQSGVYKKKADGTVEKDDKGVKQFEIDPATGEVKMETIKIDLRAQSEKDDFSDINIKEYLAAIQRNQTGFQFLGTFRYTSSGHRENAAQSYFVEKGWEGLIESPVPAALWIPNSGRLSAEVSSSDLRKMEKVGPDGHPHEVSEIDEQNGSAVRFRFHDLSTQRRNIGSAQEHTRTNIRLYRMAVGLSSEETGHVESEKSEKGIKKKIYLGGKFDKLQETTGSTIIKSMRFHYDKIREEMGLSRLTDAQAADMMVTDVIAPFFFNNRNDWLMCLAMAYDVSGTGKSGNKRLAITGSLDLQEWADFELHLVGKDVPCDVPSPGSDGNGRIKELTFKNYRQLESYLHARFQSGDYDQNLGEIPPKAEPPPPDDGTKKSFEGKIDPENKKHVKAIKALFSEMFEKPDGSQMLKLFRDTKNIADFEIEAQIKGTAEVKGKRNIFSLLQNGVEFLFENNFEYINKICEALTGKTAEEDSDEEKSNAVIAIMDALRNLTAEERKQLK